MLTAAASNALLKTLEEPPDHVRFVLATTDPQKVLPTIRSRTQHFEFQLLVRGRARGTCPLGGRGRRTRCRRRRRRLRRAPGPWIGRRHALRARPGGCCRWSARSRRARRAAVRSPWRAADTGCGDRGRRRCLGPGPRSPGSGRGVPVGDDADAFLVSLGVETPHLVEADRERTRPLGHRDRHARADQGDGDGWARRWSTCARPPTRGCRWRWRSCSSPCPQSPRRLRRQQRFGGQWFGERWFGE